MGMFDWVQFEMACPKCGERVSGFQSKDGDCALDVVLPWTVENFYSSCEECEAEISFQGGKMKWPAYDAGIEGEPHMLALPPWEVPNRFPLKAKP